MITCRQAADFLYAAAAPHPTRCGNAEIDAHLAVCPACRHVASELMAVDDTVRRLPIPKAALRSRDAFLARLQPATPKQVRRRVPVAGWLVAASVFLAITAATFFLSTPRQLAAKPRVVEDLVELNVTLAEADTQSARDDIARARLPQLRRAVQSAELPASDRRLADKLLEHGEWLAANDDPLEAAERMHGLADEMLALAEEPGPAERSAVFAKLSVAVADRAVESAAKRATMKVVRDGVREARLTALRAKQAAKMELLSEKLADPAKQQLKKKAKRK